MQEPQKPTRNELIVHPNRSLRSPQTVLYLEPLGAGAAAEETQALPLEMWRVVRQRLTWIVLTILIGSFGGFFLSLMQTPEYEAKVSLEIQNPTDITPNLPDGSVASPESYLPTQVAILQSRSLRRRAISRLRKENFQPSGQAPIRVDAIRRLLGRAPKAASSAPQAYPGAAITVQIGLNTRIVSIVSESTDPKFASGYANALANEYIDSNLQARWDAINSARQWLAQQLDDTRTKLQTSEDQLQAYGRASNLTFTDGKESAEQDKLKEIQKAYSDAEAERISKQSAYQIAMTTPADSVPQVIDNVHLSEYQAQLADLRRQLAQMSATYTPEHPKVKQLQAQIDQVEATFNKERADVLTRIRNEYQSARMKESLLAETYQKQVQVVSEQTSKTVNYNILERDVDTNRQMYDTLLQKAREADIATAMRGSNARIIDPAETPAAPSKPNFMWNTLMGTISGLMVSVALVILLESMDRSFKSPGDVSFHLKVPELGVIPEGSLLSLNAGRAGRGNTLPTDADGKIGTRPESVELVSWRDKSSTIAESFRGAVTSILHSAENGSAPRVIMVSSAIRAEGKTTVVSNLGIALAEINHKVLLIDGDMRKPRLNEVFNLPNDWGLSDLLRERARCATALWKHW